MINDKISDRIKHLPKYGDTMNLKLEEYIFTPNIFTSKSITDQKVLSTINLPRNTPCILDLTRLNTFGVTAIYAPKSMCIKIILQNNFNFNEGVSDTFTRYFIYRQYQPKYENLDINIYLYLIKSSILFSFLKQSKLSGIEYEVIYIAIIFAEFTKSIMDYIINRLTTTTSKSPLLRDIKKEMYITYMIEKFKIQDNTEITDEIKKRINNKKDNRMIINEIKKRIKKIKHDTLEYEKKEFDKAESVFMKLDLLIQLVLCIHNPLFTPLDNEENIPPLLNNLADSEKDNSVYLTNLNDQNFNVTTYITALEQQSLLQAPAYIAILASLSEALAEPQLETDLKNQNITEQLIEQIRITREQAKNIQTKIIKERTQLAIPNKSMNDPLKEYIYNLCNLNYAYQIAFNNSKIKDKLKKDVPLNVPFDISPILGLTNKSLLYYNLDILVNNTIINLITQYSSNMKINVTLYLPTAIGYYSINDTCDNILNIVSDYVYKDGVINLHTNLVYNAIVYNMYINPLIESDLQYYINSLHLTTSMPTSMANNANPTLYVGYYKASIQFWKVIDISQYQHITIIPCTFPIFSQDGTEVCILLCELKDYVTFLTNKMIRLSNIKNASYKYMYDALTVIQILLHEVNNRPKTYINNELCRRMNQLCTKYTTDEYHMILPCNPFNYYKIAYITGPTYTPDSKEVPISIDVTDIKGTVWESVKKMDDYKQNIVPIDLSVDSYS